jgi:DNA helicase-2/ATP-dependent DNA helicase PcrA
LNSPTLIVAGPGSGKTRRIVDEASELVTQKGFLPSNVLMLTFSEKAAKEMEDRLGQKIDTSEMTISTFHSFCNDVVRQNSLESGVNPSSPLMTRPSQLVWGLTHIDDFKFEHLSVGNNAEGIIEAIIDGISSFNDELISAEELRHYLEGKKKAELNDEELDIVQRLVDMEKVYGAYEKMKLAEGVLDYDDMIHKAIKLFRGKSTVLKRYQDRFKMVLVDEFQDDNYAQLELLKLLCPSGNLFVVGDDDQSIYRFRGAYLTNVQDFERHWKGYDLQKLEKNWRSSKKIVALAKQLIDHATDRVPKSLYSENEEGAPIIVGICPDESSEAGYVVREIKKMLGQPVTRRDGKEDKLSYRDFAILSRKREDGRKFAAALRAEGIPCVYAGELNPLASKSVNDLLCYLRVANDPIHSGVDFYRLLRSNGITELNIQSLNKEAAKMSWHSEEDSDFVFEALHDVGRLGVSQKKEIQAIVDSVGKLCAMKDRLGISSLVHELVMKHTDIYRRLLADKSPGAEGDRAMLGSFLAIADEYGAINRKSTVRDFLDYVDHLGRLDFDSTEFESGQDAVQVMTIHQSKGKEFPVVFVADVSENHLPLRYREKKFFVPDDMAHSVGSTKDERELYRDEERRLLYVAMTRAMFNLYLTYSKQYGQNKKESGPSPFLKEVDFRSNPLIQVVEVPQLTVAAPAITDGSAVERVRDEQAQLAIKAIRERKYAAAVQRAVNLAKLEHFEEEGDTKGFDAGQYLKPEDDGAFLGELLHRQIEPLVTGDFVFSASSLEKYEDCPLQFKFSSVLQIPTAQGVSASLGSVIHETLQKLTEMQMGGDKLNFSEAKKVLESNWDSRAYPSKKKEGEDRVRAEAMLKYYLEWQAKNKNVPLATENKFDIAFDDHKIRGKIDRIEKTPSGEIEIIDFKTGKNPPSRKELDEHLQLHLYGVAVQSKYGKMPKTASLLYLEKGKSLAISFDQPRMDAFQARLKDDIDRIMREEFKPTPSYQTCRYCDYQSICDARMVGG